jgi:hypothetical protein
MAGMACGVFGNVAGGASLGLISPHKSLRGEHLMRRRISAVLVVAFCFLPLLQGQTHAKPKQVKRAKPAATMPLTTSSAKALDLYRRAVEN